MPQQSAKFSALIATSFLLLSMDVTAASERTSNDLSEVFPFRLGMHCGDAEELLDKIRKGHTEGLEYYAKQFKSETSTLYTCTKQPMRYDGSEVPRYGFDMSISGSAPERKYSRGSHSIYFDQAGTAIAIIMERSWSPDEPSPSISSLRKSLEAKYGKPAISFGYFPNWEKSGGELIWGTKLVSSSARSDERTKEIGTDKQWAKAFEGCRIPRPQATPHLNSDCTIATIKMLSRDLDVAKQSFDDVRVDARVTISNETNGSLISMRIEAMKVKAFSKYKSDEEKDRMDRLLRWQQKTIPKF